MRFRKRINWGDILAKVRGDGATHFVSAYFSIPHAPPMHQMEDLIRDEIEDEINRYARSDTQTDGETVPAAGDRPKGTG